MVNDHGNNYDLPRVVLYGFENRRQIRITSNVVSQISGSQHDGWNSNASTPVK